MARLPCLWPLPLAMESDGSDTNKHKAGGVNILELTPLAGFMSLKEW